MSPTPSPNDLIIGVLALQGDFAAHAAAVTRAGGFATEVRTPQDLELCQGLIIPGGESSVMLKIVDREGLWEPLLQFGLKKPIYGTCAGAILLATKVLNPEQASLGLMDLEVERNAYGRQVDSRIVPVASPEGELEAVFIRAPIIRSTGSAVRVLARYQGDPVWVEDGRHMVTTFHPELSTNAPIHRRFLQLVQKTSEPSAIALVK